jgi:hypothetical protein
VCGGEISLSAESQRLLDALHTPIKAPDDRSRRIQEKCGPMERRRLLYIDNDLTSWWVTWRGEIPHGGPFSAAAVQSIRDRLVDAYPQILGTLGHAYFLADG